MRRLTELPITLKVPALVALLMLAVSAAISERVLTRLVDTQERHLRDLAAAYLDGISSALVPHVLRDDVWEVFDTLDRSRALYQALRPIETVVVDRDGLVIAASDPDRTPSMAPLPEAFSQPLGTLDIAIDEDAERAFVRRELDYQGTPVGAVYAVIDIAHLMAERAEVVAALLATNGLLAIVLAAFGYAVIRRMVAPVRILTDHLKSGATGRAEPIPAAQVARQAGEGRRLFDAYNHLVAAERQRGELAARLAEEERLASLGRLASGMAHEINNPLGGLFNALDTLKHHGDAASVRAGSVSLLERGLAGIRDVVAAALQTYRPDRSPRPFGPADIDDVRLLVEPEVRRRRLRIEWRGGVRDPLDLPSAPLRQVLLNLVLNACAATPPGGAGVVEVGCDDEALRMNVADGGPGLPEKAVSILEGRDDRAPIGAGGLGLWMVRRAVEEVGGSIRCGSGPGGGAEIRLAIPIPRAGERHNREAVDAVA